MMKIVEFTLIRVLAVEIPLWLTFICCKYYGACSCLNVSIVAGVHSSRY